MQLGPPRMKSRFVSSLCLLLLLAGCGRGSRPPHIIILLIDTLRHDRVGVYGTRKLTPFIDSFAERAYVFEHAYAQSSWTNPSVASLLTSRFQSQHGVIWFNSLLSQEELTLPEVLKQRGYRTAGYSANFLVHGPSGFNQGFDVYQSYSRQRPEEPPGRRFIKERAERLNAEALSWIDSFGGVPEQRPPLFLYMHYMEPHNPYDPPDEILDRVLGGRPRPNRDLANGDMNVILPTLGPVRIQGIEDLYDAEVMSIDARVGEFVAELEKRKLLDDTILVITADHGEELTDHGLLGHHKTLFEEVIRVPLLLRVPGQLTRVDVKQLVMLTDLAPTLLSLAGIDIPPSFEGRALTNGVVAQGMLGMLQLWWSGIDENGPPAFSELIRPAEMKRISPHERAVVVRKSKLIAGVDGEREFYDLATDAKEQGASDLAQTERNRLSDTLTSFLARMKERAAPGAVRQLDSETKERMRALGYHE